MTACKRSSLWSLTRGRFCLLRLITVRGSPSEHYQMQVSDGAEKAGEWGAELGSEASEESRVAGRRAPDPRGEPGLL